MAQEIQSSERQMLRSRVSSSNSSIHDSSYELIPREQPFAAPRRDLPSPRASFPFKRVQVGVQSSSNNRSMNQSRSSGMGQVSRQVQSKEQIERISQQTDSNIITGKKKEQQKIMIQSLSHQKCDSKIQQLQAKITDLQLRMDNQRQQFQLQRKANEVYMDGFAKIRELVNHYCKDKIQNEGIQQLTDRLEQLMKRANSGSDYQLIQQQQQKIAQLRLQLLRSSQNNINAIFNTQITQAHCMHLQIKKLNTEIGTLKQNLIKVTNQNQYHVHQMMNKQKVVKVYHHNTNPVESSDQEDIHTQLKLTRRRRENRHCRRDSSESQRRNKSKILNSTQSKVGQLVEGYKVLREQYKRLQNTLGQLCQNHSDHRHLFQSLRTQINTTLQTQLRQVKQTLKRPSSSHSELRVARDIESKLNHLVNTLNAPERVNIQQNMGQDEASDWKSVEVHRRIVDLEGQASHISHMQKQMGRIQSQNEELKRRLWLYQHSINRSVGVNHNPQTITYSQQTFQQNLITQ